MRQFLSTMRAEILELAGINRLRRSRLDGSRAAILNYHRVIPHAQAQRERVEPGMYVTPETFERHVACLAAEFRVLPLPELVERLLHGRALPPRAVALTFDDGWRDNLLYAVPPLRRQGLSAAIFVVSERVGTGGAFWADEISAGLGTLTEREREAVRRDVGASLAGEAVYSVIEHLKDLPASVREKTLESVQQRWHSPPPTRVLLDWDELRALATEGFAIESHGGTHETLTTLPEATVRKDLLQSLEALRQRGFAANQLLAYPAGRWSKPISSIAREVGYRAAFTIERALATAHSPRMALPRLLIHDAMSRTRAQFLSKIPGAARDLVEVQP